MTSSFENKTLKYSTKWQVEESWCLAWVGCHFPRKPEVPRTFFTYLKSAHHVDDFRFFIFFKRMKIKKVNAWRHFWCYCLENRKCQEYFYSLTSPFDMPRGFCAKWYQYGVSKCPEQWVIRHWNFPIGITWEWFSPCRPEVPGIVTTKNNFPTTRSGTLSYGVGMKALGLLSAEKNGGEE